MPKEVTKIMIHGKEEWGHITTFIQLVLQEKKRKLGSVQLGPACKRQTIRNTIRMQYASSLSMRAI